MHLGVSVLKLYREQSGYQEARPAEVREAIASGAGVHSVWAKSSVRPYGVFPALRYVSSITVIDWMHESLLSTMYAMHTWEGIHLLDWTTGLTQKYLVQCRREAKPTYSLSCFVKIAPYPYPVPAPFLELLEVKRSHAYLICFKFGGYGRIHVSSNKL